MKSLEKIRESPKRRKKRKIKAETSALKIPDELKDLPLSSIDHDIQSQFTYQMSEIQPIGSRQRASELFFKQSIAAPS